MKTKNYSTKFLTIGAAIAAAAFGLKKMNDHKNHLVTQNPDSEETTPEPVTAPKVEITENTVAAEAEKTPAEKIPEGEKTTLEAAGIEAVEESVDSQKDSGYEDASERGTGITQ